jgi:hypothetical protein
MPIEADLWSLILRALPALFRHAGRRLATVGKAQFAFAHKAAAKSSQKKTIGNVKEFLKQSRRFLSCKLAYVCGYSNE